MRYLFITGFIFMVAAQWYAPLSIVYDSEKTVEEGAEYRFRTAPVDPSDPFRGKYITLNFEAATYFPTDTNEVNFDAGQTVYATILPDSLGFAKVIQIAAEPPVIGIDYITATFEYGNRRYLYPDGELVPSSVVLEFPFQRLYVEESKASEAEKYYWTSRTDSTLVCYAVVKVLKGNTTLVDVMVNDRSLMDIVKEINTSQD
ncbi:MAG TPA: GDYXXLXY domain-containing protein [Cyclobacteriaceae bacterium]|nr:GDYXXLXY domain-containing protein [Cyclobacteriaceae bacterium]